MGKQREPIVSQKTCSDCEGNRLTYNLRCFGCTVRLAKTAKKGRKQLESMLHYVSRHQDASAVKAEVFKRPDALISHYELPTSNEEGSPPNNQGSLL